MPDPFAPNPSPRGDRSNRVARIKSVIDSTLPIWQGQPQAMPVGLEDLLQPLQEIWANWSPLVGRIDIHGRQVATGWRLPGNGKLIVTAGHALSGLLPPGKRSSWRGDKLPDGVTVSFADDGGSGFYAISCYAALHPIWDLAVMRLKDPDGDLQPLPPLPIAPGRLREGSPIAVIGYPGLTSGTLIRSAGVKHISLGQVTAPAPMSQALSPTSDESALEIHFSARANAQMMHNATTLIGHSGGLVVDLDSGAPVGIHVLGSLQLPDIEDRSDDNDAIDLWAVTREGWVAWWLGTADAPATRPSKPLRWEAQPPWNGGVEIAGAEMLHLQEVMRQMRFRAKPGQMFRGVKQDRPDDRDRPYVPPLSAPLDMFEPDPTPLVGNQDGEGSCAAFAVAAAIEHQLPGNRRCGADLTASVRMLDAMARDHDEFLDDSREGTTLRAVIKGFFHNGVCTSRTAPYQAGHTDFLLTREAAREARSITLGAYFRVAGSLSDMQMAVQEAGAVVVSAHIHAGWRPENPGTMTTIAFDAQDPASKQDTHAFLVVGYTDEGFIIRNSWGDGWGAGWKDGDHQPGHALWTYADWANNVIDAWVLRLSASTPQGFDLASGDYAADGLHRPRRLTLLGHMLQIERDWIVERGTLGLGRRAIGLTADFLASKEAREAYHRLAFIFHDPMMGRDLIERVAARMIPALKARGVYPLQITYGLDEMRTLGLRIDADAAEIAKGFASSLEIPDPFLERQLALPAQRQVADFRAGAAQSVRTVLGEALGLLTQRRITSGRTPAVVLTAGLGAIPAIAWQRSGKARGLGHSAALAAPVLVPADWRVMQLAPRSAAGKVAGYGGDMVDLLAVALAEGAQPRAAVLNPSTSVGGWPRIESAMIDRNFLDWALSPPPGG